MLYYWGQLFELNLSPNYNTDTWAIGFSPYLQKKDVLFQKEKLPNTSFSYKAVSFPPWQGFRNPSWHPVIAFPQNLFMHILKNIILVKVLVLGPVLYLWLGQLTAFSLHSSAGLVQLCLMKGVLDITRLLHTLINRGQIILWKHITRGFRFCKTNFPEVDRNFMETQLMIHPLLVL